MKPFPGYAEEQRLIEEAIADFPTEFGLRGVARQTIHY